MNNRFKILYFEIEDDANCINLPFLAISFQQFGGLERHNKCRDYEMTYLGKLSIKIQRSF